MWTMESLPRQFSGFGGHEDLRGQDIMLSAPDLMPRKTPKPSLSDCLSIYNSLCTYVVSLSLCLPLSSIYNSICTYVVSLSLSLSLYNSICTYVCSRSFSLSLSLSLSLSTYLSTIPCVHMYSVSLSLSLSTYLSTIPCVHM